MKIGITHGDFNGANYEILLKIFEDPRMVEIGTPVIYGSPRVAAWYRKTLNMEPLQFNFIEDVEQVKQGQVNLVNVLGSIEPDITPGIPSAASGEAARTALRRAVADLKDGKIDLLVTAPINKATIQNDEFSFPGHTEYLEKELADEDHPKALMVLTSERLKVALVTAHAPISRVASLITKETILEKLRLFRSTLEDDFTLRNPRIAVLALNPHSGDKGTIGNEDTDIIAPAIEEARKEGILAFGPYAADGFFGAGTYAQFDGVLAMYHDQGLIPLKMLSMDNGVNFTAGLPYVRTSPDHGTAYDIAGKNVASVVSMRAAIYEAIDIARRRFSNHEAKANPLEKHYHPSRRERD